MSAELVAMFLADARLPVAGHTQSAGLEPALRAGLRADEIPSYLETRLATVTRVDAGTAVVALHALRQGLPLAPVEAAWAARTPSAAMRATSRSLARGYLRLATRLWPTSAPLATVSALPGASRSVVLAGIAAEHGLSPALLVRLIGYDESQTIAAAALKLSPLDPTVTTGWVWSALRTVDALAVDVAGLTSPDQIPAFGTPQIEAWAEAHARTTRRLFSA